MDRFDRAILQVLQREAQLSYAVLAERIGLSPSSCHKRVQALWQSGLIREQVVVLDDRKAGLDMSVFVQATLTNQQEATLAEFERAVAGHPEIMECYLMAGPSDYLLRILCRDGSDYERVHGQILTRLPGVERVVTSVAIRKVMRRTALPI